MYFMTIEAKEKKIHALQEQIHDLELRSDAIDIALSVFREELDQAYEADIIRPILEKAGLISRKDPSTT